MGMRRTTRFLVSWPLQGATSFRSPQSEVVLSDVYWRWIYEALSELERTTGKSSSFVDRVENGFESDLEKAVVDAAFVTQLRGPIPRSRLRLRRWCRLRTRPFRPHSGC